MNFFRRHLRFCALGFFMLFAVSALVQCRPEAEAAPDGAAAMTALESFEVVYGVLQHPRCMNCHPGGDRPLQHDDHQPHAMNVQRGPDDRGRFAMRCDACHGTGNLPGANMPPGVSTGWHLAPREMVFEGLSRHELAKMLMDPERSHMSSDELIEHVTSDPLVLWGWDPGDGREPVPTPHAEFAAAFRTWIAAGAPAPPEEEAQVR